MSLHLVDFFLFLMFLLCLHWFYIFMAGQFALANHNSWPKKKQLSAWKNISDCLQYDLFPFNYLDQHAELVAASTGAQNPPG